MRLPSTPSVIKYSLAVLARRSPRARLYCSVPRSSQCPSISRLYCGFLLSQFADVVSAACASFGSVASSKAKYASCRYPRCCTARLSSSTSLGRFSVDTRGGCVSVCTKSGGFVTLVSVVVVIVGTGGIVAAVSVGTTLGFTVFLLRQAGTRSSVITAMPHRNPCTTFFIVRSTPFRMITVRVRGPRWSLRLLRPVRILVLPVDGERDQVGAVDAHPVDLPLAAAIRLKGDPSTIRRPGRLLVRALAGDHAALARHEVHDANLKAAVDARGVRDLFAVGRPRRIVVPFSFE